MHTLPDGLQETGLDEVAVFEWFKGQIESHSARLDAPLAFAHMDPPTPRLAADLVGLNARFNQNLLHPDLSPFATQAEQAVIKWLAPLFGMRAGHMCSGSTLANLTALWAAREAGATRVVASSDAHISVAKAAHILGMPFEAIGVDGHGRMDHRKLEALETAVLVLTAGTTGRGVIDVLAPSQAKWCHVDAAWAGPLRFTKHAELLAGIEHADSVAISAHKWLYQPKDSALVLFADPLAEQSISFGGAYLAVPNVGVQGSRGAAAIPLLATLLHWGRAGLAQRIEACMDHAMLLAVRLSNDPRVELKQMPETGVINWRPKAGDCAALFQRLGESASRTQIDGELWVRHVAANPEVDSDAVFARIDASLSAA